MRSLRDQVVFWSEEHTLATATVCWVGFATIAQVLSTQNLLDDLGRSSHGYLVKTTFVVLAWFFAGAAVNFYKSTGTKSLFLVILIFIFLLVLNATGFGFSLGYDKTLELGGFEVLNHLLLMEYMLILCYFAYFASSTKLRFLVFFIIAYILFAGGGRASFCLGLGALLVYEIGFGQRRLGFIMGGCAITLVAILVVYADESLVAYMLLTGGLESDSSFVARLDQFGAGVVGLTDQIAWGNVSFLVKRFGSLGFYMHNFMSAWQFYGLIGLVLYILVAVKAASKMLGALRFGSGYMDSVLGALLIYSLMGVLLVKFIGFGTFWFASGYWLFRRQRMCG